MRKPPRPSSSLQFEKTVERVTQEMLRELEIAQRAEWAANRRAIVLSEKIRAAYARKVPFEPGELYFDEDLNMVRTKKAAGAG